MSADSIDTSVLFQPVELGSLTLKNRIVMAPMTRNMAPEGMPGQCRLLPSSR